MADILAVNMHKDVTARSPGAPSSMGGLRPLIPLDLDGDEHTKYRKLLDPLFAPKQVALLEPNIRALSNDLIERFIDNGRADLFSEFCSTASRHDLHLAARAAPLRTAVLPAVQGLHDPRRQGKRPRRWPPTAIRPGATWRTVSTVRSSSVAVNPSPAPI